MIFFRSTVMLLIACFFATSAFPEKTIFDAIRSNDSEFVKNIQKGDQRIVMYEKKTGNAPLHTAILLDDEADALHFAQLLVKRGAIVNQPNAINGKTALHHAIDQRDPILLFYLLSQNADPKIEDLKHLNVFQYACSQKQFSLAKFVLFFYAKFLQKNTHTPKEIIDLLYREHGSLITENTNTTKREIEIKQELSIEPIEKIQQAVISLGFDTYQDTIQKQYTAGIRSNL